MIEIIDKFELYSFCFYIYFFVYMNDYLMEQYFIKCIFLHLIGNYITNIMFNFNIFSLIMHKYLKSNLNSIVIPQSITCMSNIYVSRISIEWSIPSQFLINYFIYRVYKEDKVSRNMRYLITFCYMVKKFIF